MKITYLGHSCFTIETNDVSIIIDPFYDENKFSPKPSHVLVTHAHLDHIGHSLSLCQKHNALFISTFEVANHIENQGAPNVHHMHIGGFVDFEKFKIKFTPALHSSSDGVNNIGVAAGIILNIEDKNIYHAGDTGLFGDMALIAKRHPLDIAMLPIGGNFTMDIDDAVYAVAELLKPKIAVPMHYNTFPPIMANPQKFSEGLKNTYTKPIIFNIGESKDF